MDADIFGSKFLKGMQYLYFRFCFRFLLKIVDVATCA